MRGPPADQLSCGMPKSRSSKQRMDDLRAHLKAGLRPTDQPLADKLARCGNDWRDGRYRCRSPACMPCRQINIRKQQRETLTLLGHFTNDDLAFVDRRASRHNRHREHR